MLRLILAMTLFVSLVAPITAHEVISGDIEITHPSIPMPPRGAKSAAGYMAISNNGATDDVLIGVESPIANSVSVHLSEVQDGIARMVHVPAVNIPHDDTILLERGGLHVMFMGLNTSLEGKNMIQATLIFQNAGRIEIQFMIEEMDGTGSSGAEMNHDMTHTGN